MAAWVVWLILAVLLGVAEVFTLTAVLGLLGVAALITSGVAAVGLPPTVQLLVFAVTSTAGLLLVRPIARRYALRPQLERFGVDALVGRRAYALTEVTVHQGTVRIGGEEWTARSYHEDIVIPAGTSVNVMQIDGATAVVYPQE
jgi:membrane protein implicated in regulation of membrane protease activity